MYSCDVAKRKNTAVSSGSMPSRRVCMSGEGMGSICELYLIKSAD